jgi:hypothetical protein
MVAQAKQVMAQRQAEAEAVAQVKQAYLERQTRQAVDQMGQVVAYKRAVETRQLAQAAAEAQVNDQVREYAQFLAARRAALTAQTAAVEQAAAGQQLLAGAAAQQAVARQKQAAVAARVAAETAAAGHAVQAAAVAGQVAAQGPRPADQGEDTVVDIKDLWAALDRSSDSWDQIVDREVKLLTVAEYIDRFRRRNITIRKPAGHYTGLIDALAAQQPGFLSAPFMNVLSYAAIMEYDFDNGTDKDTLARSVLGKEQFESNRTRVFGR